MASSIRRVLFLFMTTALTWVLAAPASAALLFNQSGDGGFGVASQGSQQTADDFELLTDAELESIEFSGTQSTDIFDSLFDITIFEDDGGSPGANEVVSLLGVSVTRSATATPNAFNYVFVLPTAVALVANTRYHLSIYYVVDELGPNGELSDFFWNAVNDTGSSSFRLLPDDPWQSGEGDLAFRLNGNKNVPAPAALGLLALGFWALRRRARA